MKLIACFLILCAVAPAQSKSAEVVVTTFPGSDICAQIRNAMASLPTGTTIIIPVMRPSACQAAPGTDAAIPVTQPYTIRGMGWLQSPLNDAPTTLTFAPGVAGFDITGYSVTIENMNLVGTDTSPGKNDGIRVRGGEVTLDSLAIGHFGGNGIKTQGASPDEADMWRYSNIQAEGNLGDGFSWPCPSADSHQGIGSLLSATGNGGWGFNLQCGMKNTFNSPLAQDNALGDYNVASSYNTFNQTYCEEGPGSSFMLGNGVLGNKVEFQNFGLCENIQNAGVTAWDNEIDYPGQENINGQIALRLLGLPGSTNNHSYVWDVGDYGSGALGVWNYTDGYWMLHFDPRAKSWGFDQPINLSRVGDPVNPAAGTIWYNTALSRFRCAQGNPVTVSNCF